MPSGKSAGGGEAGGLPMYYDGLAAGGVDLIGVDSASMDSGGGLPPLAPTKPSRAAGLFSAFVSIATLIAVVRAISKVDIHAVAALIPHDPAFWALYATYYLAPVIIEWLIYRRLWHLPVSGIGALLRKLVANELLLGYLGEVQFYAWARARLNMVAAPFGAIKDVTILSALTGNIATLIMLVVAWPLVASGMLGKDISVVFESLGVVLATSFIILLLRQRLFTLPRGELWLIAGLHIVRIVLVVGLAALMWHVVLPQVAVELWLVLATLRMLVSRLPLLPSKDLVFAGLAVFLFGHEGDIANLMAMMGMLLLITHVAVGVIFATGDIVMTRRRGGEIAI